MDILELIDDREQSNVGNSARPFACPWPNCVKSFNRKSDLQRHHRIHTNERPYSCTQQGCGKSFIQRSALTVHIRTHTGEKPHHCEYIGCGKCFSDSSSLARHRRIHTGKRPYKCVIDKCDKSFCRKTTLTKHARRTHCIRNDNELSDDDGSDSDSEPSQMQQSGPRPSWTRSRHSMVRTHLQGGHPMHRAQSLQTLRNDPSSPHSPQAARSLSQRTSFSTDPFGYMAAPMMQAQGSAQSFASNNPPTPQSPMYLQEHHDDGISPMSTVPRIVDGDFQSTPTGSRLPVSQADMEQHLKIVCSTPSKHQLVAGAPNLQNSPSSLSTCSSATSTSCQSQDFYNYRHAQPVGNYQLQGAQVDPNSMVQYQHIPVTMSSGPVHVISPHTANESQPIWYDQMAYQPPVMLAPPQPMGQPRPYSLYSNAFQMQQEWMVKSEQDTSMMLPSPRSALY